MALTEIAEAAKAYADEPKDASLLEVARRDLRNQIIELDVALDSLRSALQSVLSPLPPQPGEVEVEGAPGPGPDCSDVVADLRAQTMRLAGLTEVLHRTHSRLEV